MSIPSPVRRTLRAYWRAVRFAWAMVWETAKLAFLVQFKPEASRALYRAERQKKACGKFCRILGITVRQIGEQPSSGAMVVVANHHGLLDPWILASVLPVAFAAKAEMGTWPVMGWICRTVGIVFVQRDRRMATSQFVEELQGAMRAGVRVLVFPEGTTGDGLSLRAFKTAGFAAVAGMEDGAVLPVYHGVVRVDGAPASPADCVRVGWQPDQPMADSAFQWLTMPSLEVEVRIGEPISTDGRDRKELARLSRAAVEGLAGELLRAETGDS